MTKEPAVHVVGQDDPYLAEALTSEHEGTRLKARYLATAAGTEVKKWIDAELNRGTDPASLLSILAMVQIETFASIAGQVLKETGFETARNMYGAAVDAMLIAHAQRACAMARAKAGR